MTADQGYEIREIEFQLEGDKRIGIELGLDMSVSSVASSSPAHNRIHPKDRIIQVNGELVTSAFQLEYLVERHKPTLFVRVFTPRHGFDYINTQIDYTKNVSFGLYLKDSNNRVFAGKVDPASLAYMANIKEGDYFVHVHGHLVTKRDVAKEYIVKYIQETRTVSMLLERAASEETKSVVNRSLEVSRIQPPSVMMASDIRRIVETQQDRMKQSTASAQPAQNIMVAPGTGANQHVHIASQHHSVAIRNDNPNKTLQHVPKSKK